MHIFFIFGMPDVYGITINFLNLFDLGMTLTIKFDLEMSKIHHNGFKHYTWTLYISIYNNYEILSNHLPK